MTVDCQSLSVKLKLKVLRVGKAVKLEVGPVRAGKGNSLRSQTCCPGPSGPDGAGVGCQRLGVGGWGGGCSAVRMGAGGVIRRSGGFRAGVCQGCDARDRAGRAGRGLGGAQVDKAGGRGGAPVGSEGWAGLTLAASDSCTSSSTESARQDRLSMEARRRRPAHRVAIAARPSSRHSRSPRDQLRAGLRLGLLRPHFRLGSASRAAPGQLQKAFDPKRFPVRRPRGPPCPRSLGGLSRDNLRSAELRGSRMPFPGTEAAGPRTASELGGPSIQGDKPLLPSPCRKPGLVRSLLASPGFTRATPARPEPFVGSLRRTE